MKKMVIALAVITFFAACGQNGEAVNTADSTNVVTDSGYVLDTTQVKDSVVNVK